MEKIIYILWKDSSQSRDDFCDSLLNKASAELLKHKEVRHLQLNLADKAIVNGESMVQSNTLPRPYAMVNVWLNSVSTHHSEVSAIVNNYCQRSASFLVTESVPIVNNKAKEGQRCPGFSQIAILTRPPRIAYKEWLEVWLESHTQIAIDTQSTFGYVQNVISRTISYDAPAYDAIVEESFPIEALTNIEAFYDAVGDKKKLDERLQTMMDSCSRFLDFNKIDVFLTSQYSYK